MLLFKSRSIVLALLVFALPSLALAQVPQLAPKPVAGTWLGTLQTGGMKLRLLLKITQTPDGKLAAIFDSVDQGAKDLAIDSITSVDVLVSFNAGKYGLRYAGKLNADGSEIVGELKQGTGSFPVTFKRADKPPTLGRPQDPQKLPVNYLPR